MKKIFIIIFLFGIMLFILNRIDPIAYTCYYSGFFGSVLATIFAGFLILVAWQQLSKLSQTSSADFIHKLDYDFFTTETRILISLIDCEALEFNDSKLDKDGESTEDNKSLPYFEVNQTMLDKTNLPQELILILTKKKYYSTWEIDDLLVGLCENIGMLEQRGIVNFQMVYDTFGYYLELIWNYVPIKNYIKYCRDEDKLERKDKKPVPIDRVFYNQFQYIALKCTEYNNLQGGPCQYWWKFKRYFGGPKIEENIKR